MAAVQINNGRDALGNSPFSNPKNNFACIAEAIQACDIVNDGVRIYSIVLGNTVGI